MSDARSPELARDCAARHCWMVGPTESTRERVHEFRAVFLDDREPDHSSTDEQTLSVVDCRSVSGADEMTAAPALVYGIVPWMLEHDPSGVRRTLSTVYTLAPELVTRLDEDPPPHQHWGEMTRGEVPRLGHGLCELLHSWGAAAGASTVVFEHADSAGTADSILIAQIIRELPPELVQVVACSESPTVPDPLGQALAGLRRYDV